jgi:drug/metabolite transporter (DMT)-like permease
MTERNKALLGMVTCVLFWGFSFVSIKVSVSVFPPMTLGFLRFTLAVAVLLPIKGLLEKRARVREKLCWNDLPRLAGAGIIGVTFYFFCENNGVALVSASEASIIIGSIPVLTIAVDSLFLKSPVSLRQWVGSIVSVAGVALVSGASLAISGNLMGYLYMYGAAVCWVSYALLTRPLTTRRSQIYIVFWQSVFGLVVFIPFALAEFPRWGVPNLPVVLHIAFLGICCSALGYWLYVYSLDVLGVAVTSVCINFIPIVTVIAGFILLGERLSPLQWVGATLVLGGVSLAMVPPKPAALTPRCRRTA